MRLRLSALLIFNCPFLHEEKPQRGIQILLRKRRLREETKPHIRLNMNAYIAVPAVDGAQQFDLVFVVCDSNGLAVNIFLL